MATTGEVRRPASDAPPPARFPENQTGMRASTRCRCSGNAASSSPSHCSFLPRLGGGWYWYVNFRGYITSDDAYIDADRVSISSKMLGRIAKLTVDEGDTVTRGRSSSSSMTAT
jgi:biotin carboxyl carrier protein